MKFKSMANICKKAKSVVTNSSKTSQTWFGDLHAQYLFKNIVMPCRDAAETMFDLTEKQKESFYFADINFEELGYCVKDNVENEEVVEELRLEITYMSRTYSLFKTSTGVVYIDNDYLKPFAADEVDFYERYNEIKKHLYVCVKRGFELISIIMPVCISDTSLLEIVKDIEKSMQIDCDLQNKKEQVK